MQNAATINLETLDAAALIAYIKELETGYKTLQLEHEVLQEKYDLLVYKRFARSAEQMLADEKQQPLFAAEETPARAITAAEVAEVKAFKRKKAGRKAIDPKIPRREKIIDIPEAEKKCGCGADLTRIGEETAA